jgi:hypothetical protein
VGENLLSKMVPDREGTFVLEVVAVATRWRVFVVAVVCVTCHTITCSHNRSQRKLTFADTLL